MCSRPSWAFVLALLPGCFLATFDRSVAMSRAVPVPHPSDGLAMPVTAVAGDLTSYTVVALSPASACLHVGAKLEPPLMLRTRFELVGMRDAQQRPADAPSSPSSAVRLVDTDSTSVPCEKVVHDQVKSADGEVLATVDRTVAAVCTTHHSTIEVCFDRPPVGDGVGYLLVRPVLPAVSVGPLWMPGRVYLKVEAART